MKKESDVGRLSRKMLPIIFSIWWTVLEFDVILGLVSLS